MIIVRSGDRDDHQACLRVEALRYARDGVPILPCTPLSKKPLVKDWPQRATTDAAQVQAWWHSWPNANIGLRTGSPGFDVLDVDVRSDGDGFATVEELRCAGLLAGAVALAQTPSGGQHLYFPGTTQKKTTLTGRHIDFQAVGGYVLAPPSRILSGDRPSAYRWVDRIDAEGAPLDWAQVLALMTTSPQATSPRPSLATLGRQTLHGYVRSAPVGERNHRLFFAANRMVERGRDPKLLTADGLAVGLPASEVAATIDSAIRTSRRGGSRGR